MKSSLRKETIEAAALLDELAEEFKAEPKQPGEFTLRQFMALTQLTDATARRRLDSLVDNGRLTKRRINENGRGIDVYRGTKKQEQRK